MNKMKISQRDKNYKKNQTNSWTGLKNWLKGFKWEIRNWLETDENKTQHAKNVWLQKQY